MRTTLFRLLSPALIVGAAFLSGCSQGARFPGFGAQPLERALERPIASGDSTVVAEFALERCGKSAAKEKKECYEQILLALVEKNQVRLAMTSLEVLSQRDNFIVPTGHDYTHVVGINAWSPGEDVGSVYESCTGLFQSGCYHGVVQAYLDANGADSATVSTVCNLIPAAKSSLWLRFQCVHGLGHGLVQAKSLHLPKALGGCDWLGNEWDSESCYGGAFMEFIVAGRGQSHHPGAGHNKPKAKAGDQSDEHADHSNHDVAAASDSFAIRNKADPLYPCSVLDERYQRSCYGMQAGIMIENVGADFAKIAKGCDDAPPAMRAPCYQGVGTYISGFTVRNAEKAIDLCMKGTGDLRQWCFVGVVKNFIDVTAQAMDGIKFCQRLDDPLMGSSCYVAVGEQMSVLRLPRDERERICNEAHASFAGACRYGAALSFEQPKALRSNTRR